MITACVIFSPFGELLVVPAHHGGLDRRAGALDVLAHAVQALEEDLAGHSELLGKCAHTDFRHISPVQVRALLRGPSLQLGGAHR